jgi:hypothetical protein
MGYYSIGEFFRKRKSPWLGKSFSSAFFLVGLGPLCEVDVVGRHVGLFSAEEDLLGEGGGRDLLFLCNVQWQQQVLCAVALCAVRVGVVVL